MPQWVRDWESATRQILSTATGTLMLLMLEDDSERVARFQDVLREIAPALPLKVWRNAHVLMQEAAPLLPVASLISLDHDLDPDQDGIDPGEGYLVAQWLVSQPIVVPVIVHSSNSERARWMAGAFDLAGWRHWRVPALGEDWIETDWRSVVRQILKHNQNLGSRL